MPNPCASRLMTYAKFEGQAPTAPTEHDRLAVTIEPKPSMIYRRYARFDGQTAIPERRSSLAQTGESVDVERQSLPSVSLAFAAKTLDNRY
jgi:hypothetical protein